jgi:hypothetical protein
MNYAANFIDEYAQQTTDAIYQEGDIRGLINSLLKEFKVKIDFNIETMEEASETAIEKYIHNKKLIEKLLIENQIEEVTQLINKKNKIYKRSKLTNKHAMKMVYKQYKTLQKIICKKDSREILDNILKRINKYPEWNTDECQYNEEEENFEIFIDESFKNNKAGYGVFCKNNSKYNYFSRVEGEQTLQNATYQGVLHVLKGFPINKNINFIIDRKAVIDVLEKIPTAFRERQNSLHLDTIIQIEQILKKRTGTIKFSHCYSHLLDPPKNNEELKEKEKKTIKLFNKYGEQTAYKYMHGNKQADILADKAIELEETRVPYINKYHNKYILRSTRMKKSKNGDPSEVINTRIRSNIKDKIREKFSKNILNKPKYEFFDNKNISKYSTELLRDKHPEREEARKMMSRMIHQSLPTCEKLKRLVDVEQNKDTENKYYTNKYEKYTNEGMCPCCNQETETIRHLFFECENEFVQDRLQQLDNRINAAIGIHVNDIEINSDFIGINNNNNPNWDNFLTSMGLIPNKVITELKELLEPEDKHKLKLILADMSKLIMEINIEIWKYRCKRLYVQNDNIT